MSNTNRSESAPHHPPTAIPSASSVPSVVNTFPSTKRKRTEEQIRASQQNGRKSQGPKTEQGKSNSRKNALKHGLASQNPTLLPPDLTAEVRAEVDLFTRDLKPQTHVEQRLVESAALSCVRFLRLSHAEVTLAQSRARTAIPAWQAERKATVNQLAKTLDTARPGTASALDSLQALKQTSHGCKLLAGRYQKLIDQLSINLVPTLCVGMPPRRSASSAADDASANHAGTADPGNQDSGATGDATANEAGWHDPESSKGVDAPPAMPPFTLKHLETLARLEAFNGTMPDASDTPARKNLWRHLIALMTLTRSASEASDDEASDDGSPTRQRGFFPAPPDDPIIAHIAHHFFAENPEPLPDPVAARRKLIQYLSKRKHALTQRARHLWETQDRPARDEAPSRALFDPTPEGKLLARYMNDAQRTMRLALKELQKAQKEREKRAHFPPTTDNQPRTTDQKPIEPNTPQPQPKSQVTPEARAYVFEAHQQTNPQSVFQTSPQTCPTTNPPNTPGDRARQ